MPEGVWMTDTTQTEQKQILVRIVQDKQTYEELILRSPKPVMFFVLSEGCSMCRAIVANWSNISNNHPGVELYATLLGRDFELEKEAKYPGAPLLLGIVMGQIVAQVTGKDIAPEEIAKLAQHLNYELAEAKKLPPLKKQLRSLWKSIKLALKSDKMLVSGGVRRKRLGFCELCPLLLDKKRCGACGCYVRLKASLSAEKCPRDYW
jgi:hypothetical protein